MKEIYPGKSYPDLVLSKLRLVDARGPLGVRVSDEDSCPRAMQARLADSPLGKVADRAWRGVCSMGGESSRRIKLRTNGTFVFYEDVGKIDESRTEVFDGAWVVKNDKGPWASVDLFGRRHLSEESWSPYKEMRSEDTVRIAGGTLEVARVEDLGLQEFQNLMATWAKGMQSARVACLGVNAENYEGLVKRGAFFVRGKVMTDLFARP